MADPKLEKAYLALEQVVTKGMIYTPSPTVRSHRIATIVKNRSSPVSDAEYHQAVQSLDQRAPDPKALQEFIKRLQFRGFKGVREWITLLATLADDQQLRCLTCGSVKSSLDTLQPANVSAQQANQQLAEHKQQQQIQQPQASSLIDRGSAGSLRRISGGSAVSASNSLASSTTGTTAGGLSQVVRPLPQAIDISSLHNGSRNSSGAGTVPVASHAMQQPVQQVPPTSVTNQAQPIRKPQQQQQMQDSPPARAVQPSTKGSGATQFNPMYGQEDTLNSPVARTRDYTPSLTSTMAAARMRAPAQEPAPTISQTGDLFVVGGDKPSTTCQACNPSAAIQGVVASLPAWQRDRPHLTLNDLVLAAASHKGANPDGHDSLAGLPPGAQEVAVMNDLLYAFMGLDGQHVRARLVDSQGNKAVDMRAKDGKQQPSIQDGPRLAYIVTASLQPCAQELVTRLLPICEYVAVLQRFIETRSSYRHGLVSQALCAALHRLVSDWQLVVTQLEHQLRTGRLTLQGLQFYCQGPMTSLSLLAGIAAQAASQQLTAAGLLNLLTGRAADLAGDPAGRALVNRLLHAAAVPYFKILDRWLCEGVLDDPYGEFMIREDPAVNKDAISANNTLAYWSHRYTIRTRQTTTAGTTKTEPDVPVFLVGVADTILTTGKYLNAIRECGGSSVPRPFPAGTPPLAFDLGAAYLPRLHTAHAAASAALLHVITQQAELMSWLKSFKHFFLMDQGDVIVALAEAARSELCGPAATLSKPRLQSLLEMAVRTSSLVHDPHVDGLTLELEPQSLLELAKAAGLGGQQAAAPISHKATHPQASPLRNLAALRRGGEPVYGWEVVHLTMSIGWPLSLVVPPRALAQYQLIFRLLFQLKHAERQLSAAWHRMQGARTASKADRASLRAAYSLAQRYLYFIQEMLRYCTMDVLEPAWQAMEEGMTRRAADVDQVIQCHNQFLSRAVDGLLLSHPRLLATLIGLQRGSITFSNRVLAAWDATELQQQKLRQSQAGSQTRSGGGAQKISGGGSMLGGAQRVSVTGDTTADASSTVQLDIQGLESEFVSGLGDLLAGLKELYDATMRQETGDASQTQLLESRESVEALLGLIQRLQPHGSTPSSTASNVAPNSTAARYAQLSAAAAAMDCS